MSGKATKVTAKFKLAISATSIKVVRITPERLGVTDVVTESTGDGVLDNYRSLLLVLVLRES